MIKSLFTLLACLILTSCCCGGGAIDFPGCDPMDHLSPCDKAQSADLYYVQSTPHVHRCTRGACHTRYHCQDRLYNNGGSSADSYRTKKCCNVDAYHD